MAFGAVATGSMNDMFAARAAGTAKSRGLSSRPTAIAETTGRIVAAYAGFDMISVRKTIMIVMIRIIARTPMLKPATREPIQSARPVT